MRLPLLGRIADTIRFDQEHGLVSALDWSQYPHAIVFDSYADRESLGAAIAKTLNYDSRAAGYLACYELVLTARAWQDRPSDARRAALIQAGEHIQHSLSAAYQIRRLVAQALAKADTAIVEGADAESALLQFVEQASRRSDKIAERAGRSAVELLTANDHVLVCGFPGAAFAWLLFLSVQQSLPLRVLAANLEPLKPQAQLVAHLCEEVGLPVRLLQATTTNKEQRTKNKEQNTSLFLTSEWDEDHMGTNLQSPHPPLIANLAIAGADGIAIDGSIIAATGIAQCAALARQHAIPFYVLGSEGPDPALPPFHERIAAQSISAIITGRGIYRPERIADSLGDDPSPIDVIPLSG